MLIVGGGITGCGVARDAALRGLSVALIERRDFASGTSGRSSRLVHGGLRYLEHGHLHLVFEASRERRILSRIAPHLVRPLSFTWPVYENARVSRWKLRAGLLLYDALSLFRNLAGRRSLGPDDVAALEPELRALGIQGGAMYYDAATDDMRLTLANARSAAELGAAVANHVELRDIVEDGEIRRVVAVDSLTGATLRIAARVLVSAAGAWTNDVSRLVNSNHHGVSVRGTKGAHIAVPRGRVGNRGALTLLSPIDGRVMFVLPSGHLTIIGTTDTDYDGPLDDVRATHADIGYLIRSANSFFPAAHLSPSDVVAAWAGIRPLVAGEVSDPSSTSREHAIKWITPAILGITGGKLTTYRSMAAETVDMVLRALGRQRIPGTTAELPLPGGRIASLEDELMAAQKAVGDPKTAEHLVHAYGSEWRDVWRLTEEDQSLSQPVVENLPYIYAELLHTAAREMPMTLADVLIRRLHIAFETRDHGLAVAEPAARRLAPTLGWSDERIALEVQRYEAEALAMFGVDSEA
ncbi:MAG: glycerol-3-phosphate dehydrogenase/oxidase [Anaerolineae bacterium]|nr:glycerol-3-phosphate dehydrogenase/oxidase [Gemmatimonadaceae bacterium]